MTPTLNIPTIKENINIQTSKTYLINFGVDKIQNKIDGLTAIKQAVFMILSTQRGGFSIYPLDYGTNLNQYIGKEINYIKGDIGREIKESLLKDRRILDVKDFTFEQSKDILYITFKVISIYGDFIKVVELNNG